jgi:hypothetical protein
MARVVREHSTPRLVAAVLAALCASLWLSVAAPGAAALTPIEPDNRPTTVPGQANGQLPASLLLQIAPTCVAHRDAAASLSALIGAAAAAGVTIKPSECYRDLGGQQFWRTHYCALGRCQMAAVPGTSNHGWGKAADLKDQSGGMSFTSPGYAWLKLNAGRFGWNHPGWAEPGSSAAEPWHWEWVGDGGTKYPGLVYPTPMGTGMVVGGNPIGSFDAVTVGAPGQVVVSGWALDPDVTAPINVHVHVDGALVGDAPASAGRGDIAAAYPVYGAAHGFSLSVPAGTGTHEVCVFAMNTGLGTVNPRLACRWITVAGTPVGSVDEVTVEDTVAGATVRARGWALDPDGREPIAVHGYLDGVGGATTASLRRDDIAAAFPGFGAAHGFEWTGPVAHGTHELCLYAINIGPGQHASLGCRSFVVNRNPVGSLDSVEVSRAGRATLHGWGVDPDTAAPIDVHVYVDGTIATAVAAASARADVASVLPGYGDAHGFVADLALSHGSHTICAYGINRGAGDTNPLLGCQSVKVDLNPVGNLDAVAVARDGWATVAGWTLDPESSGPIDAHVYVDGVRVAVGPAAQLRGDIGIAFPASGPLHGYMWRLPLSHGSHVVCAYGINVGAGNANPLLGCRAVKVDLDPIGSVEPVDAAGAGSVSVHGWALDPDGVEPTQVHLYLDGAGVAFLTASIRRPDVAAAFPGMGADHGYATRVAVTPGVHRLCAFAINARGGASNPLLGCVTFASG